MRTRHWNGGSGIRTWVALAALILAGCASASTQRIDKMDAQQIQTAPLADLCQAYREVGFGSSKEGRRRVIAELKRRRLFTRKEMSAGGRGKIIIGMRALALDCFLGRAYEINRMLTAAEPSELRVYCSQVIGTSICRGAVSYVYLTNGAVTAVQFVRPGLTDPRGWPL